MSYPSLEQLGPPSVRLKAFQFWVNSRQFPDAQDRWDGNWLNVTVHCGEAGASVWATGAILDTIGLLRFRDELERMHRTLSGEATLESHEPNIVVRVTVADDAGHLRVRVEITPDHLAQGHWFDFEIDQSYLPAAVAQLESVLVAFPVRGSLAEAIARRASRDLDVGGPQNSHRTNVRSGTWSRRAHDERGWRDVDTEARDLRSNALIA